jgi:NADH:ubiquinone reductase (non-electrogenic)
VTCFPGIAADGTFAGTGVMWKGFETYSQISFRNIALVSSDWLRTKIFGRDISKV